MLRDYLIKKGAEQEFVDQLTLDDIIDLESGFPKIIVHIDEDIFFVQKEIRSDVLKCFLDYKKTLPKRQLPNSRKNILTF